MNDLHANDTLLHADDARLAAMPAAHSHVPMLVAAASLAAICLLMSGVTAADTRLVTTVHGHPVPWQILVQTTTPRWLFLAIALPVILIITTRKPLWPLSGGTRTLQCVLFLALTGGHALFHSTVAQDGALLSGPFGFPLRFLRVIISSMPVVLPLYGATLLTAWGLEQAHERRVRTLRTAQLEGQLHLARLAALRAQLHPHFLYNTLNGIAALVHDRQHLRASSALEQLADLLHAAFRDDGRELIPLSEELALSVRYLELQQLRFGDRLSYQVALAPAAADALVPPLILQPLVENAVLHGLARRDGHMQLALDAHVTDGHTTIVISQDGPQLPANWAPASGRGLGLRNTRDRLTSAFGGRAGLTVRSRAGGGVEAVLRLPAPASSPDPAPGIQHATT